MKENVFIALRLTALTGILFGVLYPMAMVAVARLFTTHRGGGQEVVVNGRVVGFDVIGQRFTQERYFRGRPSAVDYHAAATGGSNKGPTNPDYLATVQQRIENVLAENPDVERNQIPVDFVTASGSGLDPHLSVAAALLQADRIARVRGLPREAIVQLIEEHTEKPLLGLFGTEYVHVLSLNVALDKHL